MLIVIISIAFIIGIFFLIAAIALGGFVYNGVKKNSDLQKKCLRILIPSAIVWLALIVVNTVLGIFFLYNNRVEILELLTHILQFLKNQR